MTDDSSHYIPVVKLTDAELDRFRENAPAALACRDAGFFQEQLGRVGEQMLTGLVALVGVLVYDWSIPAMVVFLLVGVWIAIACDCVKYAALFTTLENAARVRQDHRRLWLVVDALRKGQPEGRAVIAQYPPAAGLFIDVVMGGMATTVLVASLSEPQPSRLPFQDLSFVLSLIVFIVYELAMTVWIVLHHRLGNGPKRPVQIKAGMRGIGLFLLFWLTFGANVLTGANPEQLSATATVLIANGWFILLGVVYGLNLVRTLRETAWLRAHLERKETEKKRRRKRGRK